mmetsp:Transcript_13683/g.32983  ORF Transcript_13683/g.32983 Transcript_13683/m.32983 type:complete len:87 (+) Transcript_13683:158-418(+)
MPRLATTSLATVGATKNDAPRRPVLTTRPMRRRPALLSLGKPRRMNPQRQVRPPQPGDPTLSKPPGHLRRQCVTPHPHTDLYHGRV